jgi:hypothetical protein
MGEEPASAGPDAARRGAAPGTDADGIVVASSVSVRLQDAPERLARAFSVGDMACVMVFLSPDAEIRDFVPRFAAALPGVTVVGCTTAGEISGEGYVEGEAMALGLHAAHFAVERLVIPDLGSLKADELIGRMIRARSGLMRGHPDWEHEFAFLMVDGLSIREDELTAALAPGLGPVQLFGGSAGDGARFHETFVICDGQVLSNAAVLTMVRTDCRARVFSLDHLQPTDRRMVVTEADPKRRIVRQINAEPAAREYARLLGKDPGMLDTFTFAAHPVVVRIGGRHHVRAIQRVAPNGDLVFFSAIDEGVVLTLAEPQEMAEHLEGELSGLSRRGAPVAILACDCILRRMEAMEKQRSTALSDVLRRFRVYGFSTYGEQLNSMHVNHTMTGVALYRPDTVP